MDKQLRKVMDSAAAVVEFQKEKEQLLLEKEQEALEIANPAFRALCLMLGDRGLTGPASSIIIGRLTAILHHVHGEAKAAISIAVAVQLAKIEFSKVNPPKEGNNE